MGTKFVNWENSKTSDLQKLLLNPTDKINLKRSDKNVALSNISINYIKKNMKKSNKKTNLKYELQINLENDKFELPGRLYSVSDIQDYFEHIHKKHETPTDYSPIRIYVNKIKKMQLHLKVTQRIVLNLWYLKQWSYVETLEKV